MRINHGAGLCLDAPFIPFTDRRNCFEMQTIRSLAEAPVNTFDSYFKCPALPSMWQHKVSPTTLRHVKRVRVIYIL